jgi:hypothetical protein
MHEPRIGHLPPREFEPFDLAERRDRDHKGVIGFPHHKRDIDGVADVIDTDMFYPAIAVLSTQISEASHSSLDTDESPEDESDDRDHDRNPAHREPHGKHHASH